MYKWFVAVLVVFALSGYSAHPVYVSVIEVENNTKAQMLEISCKVFTDDFEKTLRATYKTHVDLLDEKYRNEMNPLVNKYLQSHLHFTLNEKPIAIKFLGYEQIEEGIYCYFEAPNTAPVKSLKVFSDVMYDYIPQQMAIVHFINKGTRTSSKMVNPANQVTFTIQ